MTRSIFNKARELAINNGETFHVAAILFRRKNLIQIKTNSQKTHPRFERFYRNGEKGYHLHAEMDVLRFAEPGDLIMVLRWTANGQRTMAKPCDICENFLRQAGISAVIYSDWNGQLQEMEL